MLKRNKYLLHFIIILSFVIMSFISVYFLLKTNIVYVGWDTQFHFKRIMELHNSFLQGNLFPDFSFNEFNGSSVMSLYPYLNLFPAVLLSFLIKSKIDLVYSFFAFNTLLTFIVSFYSSKNYIKSYKTSYIFSFIYSLSSIFLTYNFVMSDLGIVSSYVFLPLAIFGLLQLFQSNNWFELSLGISLIIYGHILNFIIISLFILVFCLINIRRVDKQIIKKIIKSLFLFLIMTSIVWLQFIYVYFNNWGNINMPPSGILNNIDFQSFISGLFGNRNTDSVGFFPIISIFIFPFFHKKFNTYIKQMYYLSIIIIILTLFFPWKLITSYGAFKSLGIFQFTWRFLFIPQMILSFIFAVIITQYIKSVNVKRIVCSLTIVITIILQAFIGQYITIIEKNSNYPSIKTYIQNNDHFVDMHQILKYHVNNSHQFDLLLNSYYISDDDYIPKNAISMSSFVNRDLGFYNNDYKIKINHVGYNKYHFYGQNNIYKLNLPVYAYNNEKLSVYLNGVPVKTYVDKNGLLTINHIKNNVKTNNNIYIKNYPNIFKITGIILFFLSWIVIFIILIKKLLNNIF